MTEIARRAEQAAAEKRAKRAYEVEQHFKEGIRAINHAWVLLSKLASEIRSERLWESAGHDTLEAFLGGPDVDMGRTKFFALADMYEYLVETKGVESDRLDSIKWSKVPIILPAIKEGKVALDKALDDAEALSRSDLIVEYKGAPEPQDRRPCPTCGTNVDAAKLEAAA